MKMTTAFQFPVVCAVMLLPGAAVAGGKKRHLDHSPRLRSTRRKPLHTNGNSLAPSKTRCFRDNTAKKAALASW